jgi:hypothetical protein
MKKLNRNDLELSQDEIDIITECCNVLKPFDKLTELFSGEKTVTISYVGPCLISLIDELKEMKLFEDDIIKMRDLMVKDLEERSLEVFKKPVVLISSLLDPRYKELLHLKETKRKEVHNLIKEEASKFKFSSDNKTEISPTKKKSIETDQYGLYKYMNVKKKTDETDEEMTQHSIEKELKMYLAETVEDFDLDPINYWVARMKLYPYLSQFSLSYLSIPASSVPSERRFSSLGRITESRTRIKPETASLLLTLKDNIELW